MPSWPTSSPTSPESGHTDVNESLSAALLGIVQGLTEFLPVSSSGHLVLFQGWLPVAGDPLAFDLALHLGSLVPVLWVYRQDLWGIVRDTTTGEGAFLERSGVRLLLLLVAASVPTAIIGIGLEDIFERLFHNPVAVGVAFAVTGTVLWFTQKIPRGDTEAHGLSWMAAAGIGLVQGLAITPGISRSGSTIAAGLFLGMDREAAARFSFLMSIPAIGGAFILKVGDLDLGGTSLVPVLIGMTTSAISGYLALRVLIKLVRGGDFSKFAYYLWPLAVFALFQG
jgi:undecaprenyl-diphosphatase